MLSINQTNAQTKYTEMWKAANYEHYPIQMEKMKKHPNGRTSRGVTNNNFIEPITKNTFIGDATRLWNKAPLNIKNAMTINVAKKEIKAFCKSLPFSYGEFGDIYEYRNKS